MVTALSPVRITMKNGGVINWDGNTGWGAGLWAKMMDLSLDKGGAYKMNSDYVSSQRKVWMSCLEPWA